MVSYSKLRLQRPEEEHHSQLGTTLGSSQSGSGMFFVYPSIFFALLVMLRMLKMTGSNYSGWRQTDRLLYSSLMEVR